MVEIVFILTQSGGDKCIGNHCYTINNLMSSNKKHIQYDIKEFKHIICNLRINIV